MYRMNFTTSGSSSGRSNWRSSVGTVRTYWRSADQLRTPARTCSVMLSQGQTWSFTERDTRTHRTCLGLSRPADAQRSCTCTRGSKSAVVDILSRTKGKEHPVCDRSEADQVPPLQEWPNCAGHSDRRYVDFVAAQAECEALEARLRSTQLTKEESQRLNGQLKALCTNKRVFEIHQKQWEVSPHAQQQTYHFSFLPKTTPAH